MHAKLLWSVVALLAIDVGCSSSSSGPRELRYTIRKPSDAPPPTSGLPPDKEAEIQLLLQQRELSARKCYQDVLNEKNDRKFQGTVQVLIDIATTGKGTVSIAGGTLKDQAVLDCLVATIGEFSFPELTQPGQAQYTYQFRPAF